MKKRGRNKNKEFLIKKTINLILGVIFILVGFSYLLNSITGITGFIVLEETPRAIGGFFGFVCVFIGIVFLLKIREEKKGAAALEFVLTYSWAIIAVLAAIGALAFIGIFKAPNLSPIVALSQPFVAEGISIDPQQGIQIELGNGGLEEVTISEVTLENLPQGITCQPFNIPTELDRGEKIIVSISCSGLIEGESIEADIKILYTKSGSQLVLTSLGTIYGTARRPQETGGCTPICNNNSDCGTDGYSSEPYCGSDGNVYRNYTNYTCINPGTCDSSCESQTDEQLVQVCQYGCSNGTCIQSYSLQVSLQGTGSGRVISSPLGINCPGDCSENYSSGTLITLNATPSSNSTFAGWSGSCSGTGICQVIMNVSRSVVATFNVKTNQSGNVSGVIEILPGVFQIKDNNYSQHYPYVLGGNPNIIIWTDDTDGDKKYGGSNIHGYTFANNLLDGKEKTLSNVNYIYYPYSVTNGQYVTFHGYPDGLYKPSQIILVDIATGQNIKITKSIYDALYPDIFGNKLVWRQVEDSYGKVINIYMCNIGENSANYGCTTGNFKKLTNTPTGKEEPHIYNNYVGFYEYGRGLVLLDLNTNKEKVLAGGRPRIHGDYVAFGYGGLYDGGLKVYSISQDKIIVDLDLNSYQKIFFDIHGDKLVYLWGTANYVGTLDNYLLYGDSVRVYNIATGQTKIIDITQPGLPELLQGYSAGVLPEYLRVDSDMAVWQDKRNGLLNRYNQPAATHNTDIFFTRV